MYSFERQSSDGPREGGVDELDGLLGGFFHREMPHPWPSFRRPTRTSERPAASGRLSRWSRVQSKIALAATVALLVFGSLFFASPGPRSASGQRPIDATGATADGLDNRTIIKDEKGYEEERKARVEEDGIIYFEGQGSSTRTITITAPAGK